MSSQKKKGKRTCNYKMQPDKTCGRPLFDSEHCIFHSKDIEAKKSKFDKVFWEEEFERQKKDEKKYDFTGFVFPGDIQFKEFEKDVCFREASFFGVADFRDAKFSGIADFIWARFFGLARFMKAKFYGKAKFRDTQFSGIALFREAEFHNVRPSFSGAEFFEEANFREAKFKKGTSFGGAEFSKRAHFREAEFLETTEFYGAKFYREAKFERSRFSGSAYFSEVKFFEHVELENMEFNVDNFSFKNTFFFNVGGLSQFIEKNKEKFKPSINPRLEILSENFRLILGEVATARYPVISRQIRDDMYLLDKKERISMKRGIRKCLDKTLYFSWWLFADYGRSFLRWALWSILLAVFFAFIYHNVFYLQDHSLFDANHINEIWSGFSFIYYSVVTFTTLGFGDIVPKSGCLQFCVMAEVIFGYAMLGGLISIFANKLARRS